MVPETLLGLIRRFEGLNPAMLDLQAGRIDAVAECTCCHRETFYSYRRDNGRTGRQMGFVLLPG